MTRQVESGLPHSLTEHLLMCPEHWVGEGTGHRHDHRGPWSGGACLPPVVSSAWIQT